MSNLRSHRNLLQLSQSKLARLSRVSRFKICLYELGDGPLSEEEQSRIRKALQAEAHRLRGISDNIDVGEFTSPSEPSGEKP